LIEGDHGFLNDLDPASAARELVDDSFVKKAILAAGGLKAFRPARRIRAAGSHRRMTVSWTSGERSAAPLSRSQPRQGLSTEDRAFRHLAPTPLREG